MQGQKCSASSVVFLYESPAQSFIERLVENAVSLRIGNPYERNVFIVPVINEAASDRLLRSVDAAKSAGATIHGGALLGGGIYDKGYFVQPIIVTGLPDSHTLNRDELFPPFLTVRNFTNLEDAIARERGALRIYGRDLH